LNCKPEKVRLPAQGDITVAEAAELPARLSFYHGFQEKVGVLPKNS
jgi:hypothetical protein